MKITEKEFNVITGETTFSEREETAQEIAEREAFETKQIAIRAEADAKAEAEAAEEAAKQQAFNDAVAAAVAAALAAQQTPASTSEPTP